jgi:threonine/homoserine/homoserine lactone efflux protein
MNPMLSTLLTFLGACTLIAASPGLSTVLIIKQSLRGRRSGFLTVLGNETGVFVWGPHPNTCPVLHLSGWRCRASCP